MSTSQELITIFDRISQRIEVGSDSLIVLNKILQKRGEIEEKIADLLRSCIPDKYDKTDPILNAICENITVQANMHAKFSSEVKGRITIPLSRFSTTNQEKKKQLQNSVSRLKSQIQSVQKSHDNAVKDLENAKAKLPTLPPNKQPAQQQQIQKLAIQVKNKSEDVNKTIMKLHQASIPSLHTDFSEFDSQRLQKMQQSVASLASLIKFIDESDGKQAMILSTKIANFDGADRSQRYVTRAFDPHSTTLNDETDMYVYAIENYNSEDPSDLQFVRGDKIKVLQQHNSGWWDGECNGKRGLFPRTFVYIRNGAEKAKSETIGAVFLCNRDFNGSSGGEIKLLSGDLVFVDSHIGNKCSGQNLRTRVRGYFPMDVLESKIK
jgi:hypothetical protein